MGVMFEPGDGTSLEGTNRKQSDFLSRIQAAMERGHDAAGDGRSGAGRERWPPGCLIKPAYPIKKGARRLPSRNTIVLVPKIRSPDGSDYPGFRLGPAGLDCRGWRSDPAGCGSDRFDRLDSGSGCDPCQSSDQRFDPDWDLGSVGLPL
jgi:hypothetical protein